MGDWKKLLAGAGTDRTLQRAKSVLGKKTVYELGAGDADPTKPLSHACDCSGYICWAIGIPRQLPPKTGGWLQTTTFADGGPPVGKNLFLPVAGGQARPGDLYVYGDKGRSQGHIGLITQVENGVPSKVLHCSKGNYRTYGDAIRETSPRVFSKNPRSRVMRIDYHALQNVCQVTPALPQEATLHHALLRGDAALQHIVAEHLVLQPTGARVEGCGAFQDGLNHLAATYPECRVDCGPNQQERGYFGPKTSQAIKNFQAAHNIEANGWIGHDTTLALDAALLAYDATGRDTTQV